MTYAEIEMKVIQWSEARKIIPNSTPYAQWTKAVEELNELGLALKNEDMNETIDGIGDTMVCLINICALLDINLVECIYAAYDQIKHRRGYMNEQGIFVKEQ